MRARSVIRDVDIDTFDIGQMEMNFIDGLGNRRAIGRDNAEVELGLAGNGRKRTVAAGLYRTWQNLSIRLRGKEESRRGRGHACRRTDATAPS